MSEQILEDIEDLSQPAANGEIVHWGERKPLRVGPAGAAITAGAAFTLGVASTLVVLALVHWLGPEREIVVMRRRDA